MLRRPPRFPLFPYTTLFRSYQLPLLALLLVLWGTLAFQFPGAVQPRPSRIQSVATVPQAQRAPTSYSPMLGFWDAIRSEEHTSELQSLRHLVCRLLLEKKKI